jgi:hypothetical protein
MAGTILFIACSGAVFQLSPVVALRLRYPFHTVVGSFDMGSSTSGSDNRVQDRPLSHGIARTRLVSRWVAIGQFTYLGWGEQEFYMASSAWIR